MTNLEPIVRKLIEKHIHKYIDGKGEHYWGLSYGEDYLAKLSFPDETLSQAVDWFYFNVLQCEHKEEACQEMKCDMTDLDRALEIVKNNFRGPSGDYLIRISKVRDFTKVPLEREIVMCAAQFSVKHYCQEKK